MTESTQVRPRPSVTAERSTAELASAALAQRLRVALTVLEPDAFDDAVDGTGLADDVADAGHLVDRAVRAVCADCTGPRMWLLLLAVGATYPGPELMRAALRRFQLTEPAEAAIWVLDECLPAAREGGSAFSELELLTGQVVVDVNHAARNNYHTGIQQVIRSTMPRWTRDHEVVLAGWTDHDNAFRGLDPDERSRVLEWHGKPSAHVDEPVERVMGETLYAVWDSVVVVLDTPVFSVMPRLAAMAEFSGNRVVAVGYDCIPLVSPQYVPVGAADRNARYLSMVKQMRRIAGISAAATAEFQGFVDALPAQGLVGPLVLECELPSQAPTESAAAAAAAAAAGPPLVLCVGSLEPRKNHLAVLYAAEVLWREGLTFDLMFIGGMSWSDETHERIGELAAAGRPVTVALKVDDEVLEQSFARARFTVFPSLHEGYGLPVAESLQAATPVITANYGSTLEIAANGGALTIDPRDDESLVRAIRLLLTDDDALAELTRAAHNRPDRTWEDYAAQLWAALVEPELPASRLDGPAA